MIEGFNHGAAVGNNGTIVVTSNGGATWTPRALGKDVYLGAVYVDGTTITAFPSPNSTTATGS